MIVAEIEILMSNGLIAAAHGQSRIKFDSLEVAQAEYERVVTLLKRREEKANDLPSTIEIVGSGCRASMPLADLRCVALSDYAFSNREQSGIKEAFPNLFR